MPADSQNSARPRSRPYSDSTRSPPPRSKTSDDPDVTMSDNKLVMKSLTSGTSSDSGCVAPPIVPGGYRPASVALRRSPSPMATARPWLRANWIAQSSNVVPPVRPRPILPARTCLTRLSVFGLLDSRSGSVPIPSIFTLL